MYSINDYHGSMMIPLVMQKTAMWRHLTFSTAFAMKVRFIGMNTLLTYFVASGFWVCVA